MKTLKIVIVMVLLSLFMTSCTDLINSDDKVVFDNIENTHAGDYDTGNGGEDGGENCPKGGC